MKIHIPTEHEKQAAARYARLLTYIGNKDFDAHREYYAAPWRGPKEWLLARNAQGWLEVANYRNEVRLTLRNAIYGL